MDFENIGGNSSTTQYSLYDTSENPFGETIMSIEFHRESKTWWFVGEYENVMNIEHMKALQRLLVKLLKK